MALNQRVSYRQVTLPLEDYRVWRDGPPEEYQDDGNNQEDRATARTVQVGQRGRVDCARLAVRTGVRVGGGGRARRRDKEMSLTPIPPERCGRVAPMVVEPREGGYTARCLRCGGVGPVGAPSYEAPRVLLELG
jgi:hypothetical protein